MFERDLIDYLYIIPCALVAIVLHELAHGLVSHFLGDPTPKMTGRLTLNPLKHLDLFGTIALVLFGFGWAKPVLIDPTYYKNKKWGTALVSLAGPLTNFILVIISAFFMVLFYQLSDSVFTIIGFNFFNTLAMINTGFFLFNLLPIPPLDGSKIIGVVLPNSAYEQYMKYQRYGMFIFMFLLVIVNVLERATDKYILSELLSNTYIGIVKLIFGLFGINPF